MTFSAPVGRRAPFAPSPAVTPTVPSSRARTVTTRSPGAAVSSDSTCSQTTPSTRTSSVLLAPDGVAARTCVSGPRRVAMLWKTCVASPLPSTCATVSPCVAGTTLARTRSVAGS